MSTITKIVSSLAVFTLFALPLYAAETSSGDMVSMDLASRMSGTVAKPTASDSEIAAKQADFKRFATQKVDQLNRNLKFSKTKMDVTRLPDGTYRARFHEIDDSSLKSKVNRSKSKTSPFVAVLSYQERVYEAYGASPEACRNGNFSLVQVTPNRHIFSYTKGAWR
jgi:hypothetical protein